MTVTCTLKVTPARANALKSPGVPSTGLRTKPSLLAVMSYSRSLWSGPTLRRRGESKENEKTSEEMQAGLLLLPNVKATENTGWRQLG